MTRRYVIEHVEPATFGRCFTPRSLNQAFGPYARLDVPARRIDRGFGIAAIAVAASVAALVLAGLAR